MSQSRHLTNPIRDVHLSDKKKKKITSNLAGTTSKSHPNLGPIREGGNDAPMYYLSNHFSLPVGDSFIGMSDLGSSIYQPYADPSAGYGDAAGIYERSAGMNLYPTHVTHEMPALPADAFFNGYGGYGGYGSCDRHDGFEGPNFYPSPSPSSVTSLPPPSLLAPPSSQQQPHKPHKCTVYPCTSAFQHKKDLARHMKTVHSTGNEPYFRCRCDKTDIRKDNYLRHLEKCRRDYKHAEYMCSCGDLCGDKGQHRLHVVECTYGQGRPGRPSRGSAS